MSYLAIARKYRPATFDEIVGQEHVTRTLRNAITGNRIHHAYLFCGARGVGKTTAARALAKSLNCEQGPTPTPCGVCVSCREVTSGSSPDLIEIDGASNNSVDDIRDLRDTVSYVPTRGRYKVYLVDEVHMLSKAAFNALLKTLEEPPPHVVFIFATTEPHRILDTILSRVQRFDFKRISIAPLVERLQEIATAEGVELSDTALRWIARAGDGSMRDAQSLLDKVVSFGAGEKDSADRGPSLTDESVADILGLIDRTSLHGFLQGLLRGEPDRCFEAIAKVYDYGHEMSQFTSDLLEVMRDTTFVVLSKQSRKYLDASDEELAQLEALAKDVPAEQLTRIFNALLDVHDQVSRALRPRIVLEMAVARLATTRPVQPVSALLERLESIERKLPVAPARGSAAAAARRPARERAPAAPTDSRPRGRSSARESSGSSDSASEPDPAPSTIATPQDESQPERADPWPAFAAELDQLGGAAAKLVSGEHEERENFLIVRVAAGRTVAEARHAATLPEVVNVFRRHYSHLRDMRIDLLAGTGTRAEQQQALQQEVMDDPAFRRIVQTLGAEVERVKSLHED